MRVQFTIDKYNSRRYSKPWGAVVTFTDDARAVYDFNAGSYLGDDSGGTLYIKCAVGDIVARGQKDTRKGNNTSNNWYIVNTDFVYSSVTKNAAFEYWLRKHP
jgi:hypothetical protein